MNIAYYKAYQKNMKDFVFIEKEKMRRSTHRWDYVTKILDEYKSKGFKRRSGAGLTLHGICKKNCGFANGCEPLFHIKKYFIFLYERNSHLGL
jgi:hypothetical protein